MRIMSRYKVVTVSNLTGEDADDFERVMDGFDV